jgi:DNA-binding transcriptional regulator YiaG
MENEIDVRALREKLGLTQVQLAVALGVDQGTVSKWENGGKPRGPATILLQNLASSSRGRRRPDQVSA